MPANMQANAKQRPEIGLKKEKACIIASFLLERIGIGENRCIFAGFMAAARSGLRARVHRNGGGTTRTSGEGSSQRRRHDADFGRGFIETAAADADFGRRFIATAAARSGLRARVHRNGDGTKRKWIGASSQRQRKRLSGEPLMGGSVMRQN
ncbi:hypothetical protein [Cohnella sp. GCM10012308]|uniref:hypothetical protein n=1 Tax=Cohnella sp. GCM10012308 TaxID=3317329 RepID=UPI00361035F1